MEVFHRRQRMIALEEKLAQAQSLQRDNAELQEMNEQLLEELQKRDRAVEEAVEMICQLEEKVEQLEAGSRRMVNSSADGSGDNSGGTSQPTSSSSPRDGQRLQSPARSVSLADRSSRPMFGAATSSHLGDGARANATRTPLRTPSFLTTKKASTGALRSLYLAAESEGNSGARGITFSKRGSTLTGGSTGNGSPDGAPDDLDSPRLSVLSESSFISIYGGVGQPARAEGEHGSTSEFSIEPGRNQQDDDKTEEKWNRRLISARVEQWIGDRELSSKPQQDGPSQEEGRGESSESEDILPPAPIIENTRTMIPGRALQDIAVAVQTRRAEQQALRPEASLLQGPIFGAGILPPTPDTLSTIDQDPKNLPSGMGLRTSTADGSWQSARHHCSLLQARRMRSISDGGITPQNWDSEDVQESVSSDEDMEFLGLDAVGGQLQQLEAAASPRSTSSIGNSDSQHTQLLYTSGATQAQIPDKEKEDVLPGAPSKPSHAVHARGGHAQQKVNSSQSAVFSSPAKRRPQQHLMHARPLAKGLTSSSPEKSKVPSKLPAKAALPFDGESSMSQSALQGQSASLSVAPSPFKMGSLASRFWKRGGSLRARPQPSNSIATVPPVSSDAVAEPRNRPLSFSAYGRSVSANAIWSVFHGAGRSEQQSLTEATVIQQSKECESRSRRDATIPADGIDDESRLSSQNTATKRDIPSSDASSPRRPRLPVRAMTDVFANSHTLPTPPLLSSSFQQGDAAVMMNDNAIRARKRAGAGRSSCSSSVSSAGIVGRNARRGPT